MSGSADSQAITPPSAGAAAEASTTHPSDRHFATDHLVKDLKRRSARGGAVVLIAQGCKLLLHLGSTATLARLLTPADFGLIAMVTAFTGFVGLFKDLGLSSATVQRARINHPQVSTLFWINVGVCILLMLVAFALAPAVAWFYGEPKLMLVTMALGATFMFGGLTAQHIAILRRQMRYRALAGIEIGAMAAGILVAILLAWAGAEYWALVGLTAATAATLMALSWLGSRWMPGRPAWNREVKEMLHFGGNLLGVNVLAHFRNNADNILLGVFWGAGPLGLYTKAYSLAMLPIEQLNRPISTVVISALSRLQDRPSEFSRYFCQAAKIHLTITLPLVAFLIAMAEEVILIVLGRDWIDAARIFQILGLFAMCQLVAGPTRWLLISLGQTNRMFKWQMFHAPLLILAFAIGLPWGGIGVAAAATIASGLTIVPYLLFAFRKSPLKIKDYGAALWRSVVLGMLVWLLARSISTQVDAHATATLAISGLAMILLAVVLLGAFRSLRTDVMTAISMLRKNRT